MDISSREVKILFDEKGRVVDILPQERGESEIMIEEFMIKANETIAEDLQHSGYSLCLQDSRETRSGVYYSTKTLS